MRQGTTVRIPPAAAICTLALALALAAAAAKSAAPPIEAFARPPKFESVSISPDGRYLAWIQGAGDVQGVVVAERAGSRQGNVVMSSDSDPFRLSWCAWANDSRLLCGLHAMSSEAGVVFEVTRLVAVNADGSKMKVLVQNSSAGDSQFQDRILDWTPAEPDTVLVAEDDDRDGFPSVFELNIYDGRLHQRLVQHDPIRSFITDKRGHVRIGTGYRDTKLAYFAKLDNDRSWRQLAKFEAFSHTAALLPIAVGREPNTLYAMGTTGGRDALFEMDLTDQREPAIVFSHPQVDVGGPLFAKDGRMIGVAYETDRQYVYYTDPQAQRVMAVVNTTLAGAYNTIEDSTQDETAYVVRSSSDVDAGTFYVYDAAAKTIAKIGRAYPELDPGGLGRMRSIAYPARDGTRIPGYLTVPPGKRAEQLPLIVMPHGGPFARDSWGFDFLLQFLVSRGYAVLQMNFRGSSGYGDDWYWAAHQDWGGLTYDDITDGARWAVKEGIADPKRMCIVGWSFGGYAALLGAVRNSDLYRCSVSIAGVSDLVELEHDARSFTNGAIARRQIGTDDDKLRMDSPRRHAESVGIPILMIHGDHDWQVDVGQSKLMAKALTKAHKPPQFVVIKGANHQMERQSDRVKLLTELEKFLAANL